MPASKRHAKLSASLSAGASHHTRMLASPGYSPERIEEILNGPVPDTAAEPFGGHRDHHERNRQYRVIPDAERVLPNPYEAAFHEVLDHPYEAARKDGDGRPLFTRDGNALLAMTQDGEVVEVERAIEGEDWSDFGPGGPDRASRLSCRS